jgi:hypothetical protein
MLAPLHAPGDTNMHSAASNSLGLDLPLINLDPPGRPSFDQSTTALSMSRRPRSLPASRARPLRDLEAWERATRLLSYPSRSRRPTHQRRSSPGWPWSRRTPQPGPHRPLQRLRLVPRRFAVCPLRRRHQRLGLRRSRYRHQSGRPRASARPPPASRLSDQSGTSCG